MAGAAVVPVVVVGAGESVLTVVPVPPVVGASVPVVTVVPVVGEPPVAGVSVGTVGVSVPPVVPSVAGGFVVTGGVVTTTPPVPPSVLPPSLVAGMSVAESYPFLDDWVLGVLRDLGLDVWYQPLNDIASGGGKIGGAAQKRMASGAVLHHVTMSYSIDGAKLGEVLRVGREKLSAKGVASAAKRVDPLARQTGLAREVVIERLIEGFRSRFGLVEGPVSAVEESRAGALVESKFATDAWLWRVR